MNRTSIGLAACAFALAALGNTSCSGNNADRTSTTADSTAQVSTDEPYADATVTRTDTMRISGRTYEITITREADKNGEVVSDELSNKFYDNSVRVRITADGEEQYDETYNKKSFDSQLSESEKQGSVLLGMAFDAEHSDSHAIYLGAQVGQPGIGEGPAFLVEIPLNGGSASITRDRNQDTSGDDGITD